MSLLFEEKVTRNRATFIAKVKSISARLLIEPDWLMAVMYKESGINEKAVNPNGGATGLIQFMPATAKSLGTTTAALKAMSNVEQLDYVYKYYKPYVTKLNSYPDLYLATFFPAALGKSDDWVLQTSSLSAKTIARETLQSTSTRTTK
ncbi:MAG: transglycosylase SLT domain-containing protein [Candidatus Onthomorpha sp.]|nr:transglycosylase SLT domain-containing protein [Bacteroidales bacterium]MCI7407380.1 transglycosylase SLT domain-containing protein [Bacteroidales bacterium]MDD7484552.1 transglycosylase SLT domain-containing protein [Bacteroidales bacterium]MDY5699282.1 transglycosylase SLT domain-containing protein [Candidatus Onthomorpha sp.]